MMTNTYPPHVGGVARSVQSFTDAYREEGHRVMVVAPTYDDMRDDEEDVIRLPAIQNFNGSDFSVRLPVPGLLTDALDAFDPDIVHSHHPFLLGDTALRVAARYDVPVVFTHHTRYELYTHYVPVDSPVIQRYAVQMATQYANLCDHVIAPSESIADLLHARGVSTPVTSIPTGIDVHRFSQGDGAGFRRKHGLRSDRLIIGHVGRLAPEKNLPWLAEAVATFLERRSEGCFFVIGDGKSRHAIRDCFEKRRSSDRLVMPGCLCGQDLIDAYHAMDIFAFASLTETQGMVLAEAQAAGTPVVAVDAPGTREVVDDKVNGRLVEDLNQAAFVDALAWIADLPDEQRTRMITAARHTGEGFSIERCARCQLDVYEQLAHQRPKHRNPDDSVWSQMRRRLELEWNLWSARARAALDAE